MFIASKSSHAGTQLDALRLAADEVAPVSSCSCTLLLILAFAENMQTCNNEILLPAADRRLPPFADLRHKQIC